MILLAAFLTQILHMALLLAAAPLLTGLLRRCKARLVGRVGPPGPRKKGLIEPV